MKNYRITVNGTAYDVAVEELGAGEASAAPVSTPAAVPAPAKLQPQQALSRLQLQCQVRS